MNANQAGWGMEEEQHQTNPFVLIHRTLRGRYPLVIASALLFGVAGAVAGYLSRQPMYASTGIIRIKPELPKVLFESEQSTAPRMFTSFVNSQALLISDVEVITHALESDEVSIMQIERDIFLETDEVMKQIDVIPDRRAQEIIRVSYEHQDSRVSKVIVDAVLKSYIEKHGREGSIKNPGVRSVLENRKIQQSGALEALNVQIADIVERNRTENLQPLIDNAQRELGLLETEQKLVKKYLEQHLAGDSGEPQSVPETPEAAALQDSRMATLVQQRDALVENRTQMMIAEGLREGHRDVRRVTMMIENIEKSIDERMDQIQSGQSLLEDDEGNPLPSDTLLRKRQVEISDEIEVVKKRAGDLVRDSLELDAKRSEREHLRGSLLQVENRIDTIDTESQLEDNATISGKISIASRAIEAKKPTSDPRKKMAAAGFVGAGAMPIMVFIAIGYLSHRVNYSDDEVLTGANAGVVGMLPDLGSSLEDQELASASAFAVHQIRSQLQIKSNEHGSCVYGVTSPAPGDGKTSLIIAMGLSFAESGSRTLLLDLDFIGRGLSVHFGHARSPSLADRLNEAGEVEQLIHETEFPGLSILPAGYGDDMRVSKLSPKSVSALLEPLRKKFDTILIDSGPILGSVEAAFISPQADGVLLVVGRGQYKPLIRKAIDQIQAVDGKIAATIFNRASMHEMRHSSSSMSVHFSRQFSRQQQEHEQRKGSKVGPVAGALFTDRRSGDTNLRKAES